MKLIIDIPEDVYKRTKFYKEFRDLNDCVTTIKALENGIPLPKGHGRLIDADDVKANHKKWLGYLDDDMIARLNIAVDKHIPTIVEADSQEQ